MTNCPCQSETDFTACCEPYLQRKYLPKTPEQLMRSRYTAYTRADVDYIQATMSGKASLHFDPLAAKKWAEQSQWLGLNVINAEFDPVDSDHGFVTFFARYKVAGKLQYIYELSEFRCKAGQWYYIDGKMLKPGRNDPCPCGSGKKFKSCCAG